METNLVTFGSRAFDFYCNLTLPTNLPKNLIAINPVSNNETKVYVEKFFSAFFNDNRKRVFVLGINPGRFGSGMTGVTFTDPIALEKYCKIKNSLPKRGELSSKFIYMFIDEWGGAKKFYSDFFLSAVSPIGFTKNGLNYNYYDDKILLQEIMPFIIKTLRNQNSFGAKEVVIILGSGKNMNFFTKLNDEYHFFKKIYALPHPRYIMQYKRKYIKDYLKEYSAIFSHALLAN